MILLWVRATNVSEDSIKNGIFERKLMWLFHMCLSPGLKYFDCFECFQDLIDAVQNIAALLKIWQDLRLLKRPREMLSFRFRILRCWGDSNFERLLSTACRPVSAKRNNMEIFAVLKTRYFISVCTNPPMIDEDQICYVAELFFAGDLDVFILSYYSGCGVVIQFSVKLRYSISTCFISVHCWQALVAVYWVAELVISRSVAINLPLILYSFSLIILAIGTDDVFSLLLPASVFELVKTLFYLKPSD